MDRTLVADVYKLHGTASSSIHADAPLEEAIGEFAREPDLRGLFLVDSEQRFVGMVTRIDLLTWAHGKLAAGKGIYKIPVPKFLRIGDAVKARDLLGVHSRILAVKESDTLEAALVKMLDQKEDVLPVLDGEGKILGDLMLSEVLTWVLNSSRRAK